VLSEHPRSARRIRQYWAELRDWDLSADLVNVVATPVVRCKTEAQKLEAEDKAETTRTVPRAASDISQSHDASARDFVQKHFRTKVGSTQVLDTAEGPINFARDLMSLTRTALFSGQSLGNMAAFMAQKAAAYDHDWVPVLADGGNKAESVFELLEALSKISTGDPPLWCHVGYGPRGPIRYGNVHMWGCGGSQSCDPKDRKRPASRFPSPPAGSSGLYFGSNFALVAETLQPRRSSQELARQGIHTGSNRFSSPTRSLCHLLIYSARPVLQFFY
jgi:hypothetical protein